VLVVVAWGKHLECHNAILQPPVALCSFGFLLYFSRLRAASVTESVLISLLQIKTPQTSAEIYYIYIFARMGEKCEPQVAHSRKEYAKVAHLKY
jgi:hypothetical protein